MEEQFIYYPTREIGDTPARWKLPFEEAFFPTADGLTLHGWFVPREGARTTLILVHGNGGNISHRLEMMALFHTRLNAHLFIFDYRGYGKSGGAPSEEGTYQDGEAALQYLGARRDVDPRRIVYFGQSLGAAVAVEMALRHPPLGLILEAPFTSVQEMTNRAIPLLPLGFLFRTRYDSLSKIGRVTAPLLLLHGDRDTIVPFEMGRRIFEAAGEPKEFYTIRGADHNDTYFVGGEAYLTTLARFIDKLDAQARGAQ